MVRWLVPEGKYFCNLEREGFVHIFKTLFRNAEIVDEYVEEYEARKLGKMAHEERKVTESKYVYLHRTIFSLAQKD